MCRELIGTGKKTHNPTNEVKYENVLIFLRKQEAAYYLDHCFRDKRNKMVLMYLRRHVKICTVQKRSYLFNVPLQIQIYVQILIFAQIYRALKLNTVNTYFKLTYISLQ